MATFSVLVNQPQILNDANINRPCRYIAQAGALAQFAALPLSGTAQSPLTWLRAVNSG